MAITIEHVDTTSCSVGESPIWDPVDGVLYFVDIGGGFHRGTARQLHPAMYCLTPETGNVERWDVPASVGSLPAHWRWRVLPQVPRCRQLVLAPDVDTVV